MKLLWLPNYKLKTIIIIFSTISSDVNIIKMLVAGRWNYGIGKLSIMQLTYKLFVYREENITLVYFIGDVRVIHMQMINDYWN